MPTHNFGAFIGETLASIVPQLAPAVEIIVLDGGSTDNTPQVVEAFARENPALSYVRQPFKGGIDRDMARSVELASGDYVWLFSSDDVMRPQALGRVLREIQSGLDLYLCGLTLCDKQMRILGEHPVSLAQWGSVFQLADAGERERYFALAQTTTAFFSFMGSLIFRRAKWQEGWLEEAYVGSCWAHVVRFMRMVHGGLSVKYLGESLQLKRGENDSFMDKGVIHRYGIAIDGYHRIAADVFGEGSFEARHMRRVIANEFPLSVMFFTRVHCRDQGRTAEISELNRLVAKTYCDLTWRNLLRRAGYSPAVELLYTAARRTYKFLRRHGLAPARK
jgi:abequosyltransferase